MLSASPLTRIRRHRFARPLRAAAALATLAALAGCQEAVRPFAGTPPGGRQRVEDALTALFDRYGNVHHTARYNYVSDALAGNALVPSRIFNDTLLWPVRPDSVTRRVDIIEYPTAQNITEQDIVASAPYPTKLGEASHQIVLRKLDAHDYSWDTNADIALGTIKARDVADGMVAWFTSGADHRTDTIRADYLGAFPQTSAVLSQLFSMDSLVVTPQPDGSSLITVHFTLHPDRLKPAYPAFSNYMSKYVDNTDYDFTLSDHSGNAYFKARSHAGPVVVRARVLGHEFLPLAGGEMPMPDSLTASGSFSTRIMFFTVGVHHFTGDFVIGRSAHMRSWTIRFNKEPDWELPPAAAALLGSSLKRPFEGNGMWYQVAVRDTVGAQTILTRTSHAEVHESPIMRFIGGLVSRVVMEQNGEVEKEELSYFGRIFLAMRSDFGKELAAEN